MYNVSGYPTTVLKLEIFVFIIFYLNLVSYFHSLQFVSPVYRSEKCSIYIYECNFLCVQVDT